MSEQIDITKKTTSKRRQESSRAKGAKSRGPVTPEGKARSSQNARTHGCLSSILTRTPEEFVSLGNIRQGYELRYRPRDQSEWDLVEQAVIANWKMRDEVGFGFVTPVRDICHIESVTSNLDKPAFSDIL